MNHNDAKIHHFLIALLFVAMLAGGFSLERLNPNYKSLGLFGQPRYWLLTILVLCSTFALANTNRAKSVLTSLNYAWLWVVEVTFLHVYIMISFAWAPSHSGISANLLPIIAIPVLLFIAYFLFQRWPEESIGYFLKLFFWTALVFTVAGLLGPGYWKEGGRLASFWGGPNVFIRIVATGFFGAVYLWVKTEHKYWLLPVPLLLAASILSGSRGGMLSLLATFPLLIIAVIGRISKTSRAVLVGLFVVVIVFLLYPSILGLAQNRYFLDWSGLGEIFAKSRAPWFEASFRAFGAQPFSGVGLNGLGVYGVNYSHNIILNIASEGGIAGLILTLIVFGSLIPRWFKPRTLEHNVALIVGIFYLLASMFSGTYYDWRFLWLFLFFYMLPDAATQRQGMKQGMAQT